MIRYMERLDQRDYTHYSSPHLLYTRIDYFLIFGKDKDKINTCEIGTIDLRDHAPIYLSVDLNLKLKMKSWKLNSQLTYRVDIHRCVTARFRFSQPR